MSIERKATEFAGLPVIQYQPVTGLVLPIMPRLDFHGPDPGTFWSIALERERVLTCSGTLGKAGRAKTLSHATPDAARDRYREMVAEKVSAGWWPPSVTREYRLDGGGSPKLCKVFVSGTRRTVLAGNAGTAGLATSRKFRTHEAALADCERLIAARVAEGYVECKPAPGSLREALLAAVVIDPGDAASRNAFLDYLVEQGETLVPAAYRVDGNEWGEGGLQNLRLFLNDPAVGLVEALVVGSCWDMHSKAESVTRVIEALIDACERLPRLRALFLGDILRREHEISWIKQSDITPLLAAYPRLEHFRSRGGDGLVLKKFKHTHLKSLVIEASNLKRDVVRSVGSSDLPALEHLELWLGTAEYDADTTPTDLAGVLEGKKLPSLRHLGLRNSEIADEVTIAVAASPILGRVRVLDLSLGGLSDRGVEALLAAPALRGLEKIDIHHHNVSPTLVERLEALGITVVASGGGADRYVAHSE